MKPEIIKHLKGIAKQHHLSLQSELKSIAEIKKISQTWQQRLKFNSFSDSSAMVREDRGPG